MPRELKKKKKRYLYEKENHIVIFRNSFLIDTTLQHYFSRIIENVVDVKTWAILNQKPRAEMKPWNLWIWYWKLWFHQCGHRKSLCSNSTISEVFWNTHYKELSKQRQQGDFRNMLSNLWKLKSQLQSYYCTLKKFQCHCYILGHDIFPKLFDWAGSNIWYSYCR